MANTNTTTTNATATNAVATTTTTTYAATLTDTALGIQTVSLVQDTTATSTNAPTTNLVTAALLPELVYAANAAPTSLPNTVAGTVVTTTDTSTAPMNMLTEPALLSANTLSAADGSADTAATNMLLTDVATPVDLSSIINTVDPLLTTNNGAPLVVIDSVVDSVLIDPATTDPLAVDVITVPTDVTIQNAAVTEPVINLTLVTDTTTPVEAPLVNTPVVIDTTVITDTAMPVETPVVDTPVVTDTTTPVDVPVNTVDAPMPEDIDLPAPGPVMAPVITSITDSAAQAIAFGGSTQDTQPTLRGTSEPGTIVNIRDNDQIIGQATAGDDWQWSFTTTALTSGMLHALGVDAARADGSGGTVGAYQVMVGIGVAGLPLAAPVITDIMAVSNGVQTLLADGGQTDDLRPVLRGTSEPGTVVDIYDQGVKVGQALTNADWQWEFQPAQDLGGNSAHSFTATASLADGSRATSSVYASSITIGSVTVTDMTTDGSDVPVIPLPPAEETNQAATDTPMSTDPVTTGTDTLVVDTTTDSATLPLILNDSDVVTLDQLLANAGLTATTDTTQNTGTVVGTTATTAVPVADITPVITCPHAHATAAHDFAY